jgi:uncharacterized protein YndB with AHSA1/START domain
MFTEANGIPELRGETSIAVSRIFDAPRELVWESWADPAQRGLWWGPNGFTTEFHSLDLRPGGQCLLTMRGPDGTEYPNRSVFTKVERPHIIAYAHSGNRVGSPEINFHATWTFEEVEGGKTQLTLLQEYADSELRRKIVEEYGAIKGGEQTFARLAEFLTKIKQPA